jgi:hypothetical protein
MFIKTAYSVGSTKLLEQDLRRSLYGLTGNISVTSSRQVYVSYFG